MQGILKTKPTFSNKKRSDNIHYPIVIVYQNYEKRKNTMSNVINDHRLICPECNKPMAFNENKYSCNNCNIKYTNNTWEIPDEMKPTEKQIKTIRFINKQLKLNLPYITKSQCWAETHQYFGAAKNVH